MKKLAASFAAIALLSLSSVASVAEQHEGHESQPPAAAIKSGVFKDPICGMDVTVKGARYMCEYKKNKYYFCSKDDMEKFKKSPAKYLDKKNK